MKYRRIWALTALLALLLTACAPAGQTEQTEPAPQEDTVSPEETIPEEAVPEDEDIPDEAAQTATLYVGTKALGFTEYPLTYEGELTPALLIQGIADLTGWDLTLAEPVTSGKGGMSVCLASQSSLFVGPPQPQVEAFFVYDQGHLAEILLDSIQKTLQMGFTGAGGDPDALDIWYYMEGEQPLTLADLGLTWPLDQPYQWANAVILDPVG